MEQRLHSFHLLIIMMCRKMGLQFTEVLPSTQASDIQAPLISSDTNKFGKVSFKVQSRQDNSFSYFQPCHILNYKARSTSYDFPLSSERFLHSHTFQTPSTFLRSKLLDDNLFPKSYLSSTDLQLHLPSKALFRATSLQTSRSPSLFA